MKMVHHQYVHLFMIISKREAMYFVIEDNLENIGLYGRWWSPRCSESNNIASSDLKNNNNKQFISSQVVYCLLVDCTKDGGVPGDHDQTALHFLT